MRVAMTQLNLSARAYHGILKLARTIADLAGSDEILSCVSGGGVAISPKIIMGDLFHGRVTSRLDVCC